VLGGVHTGATWRIPCREAMRPVVRLICPLVIIIFTIRKHNSLALLPGLAFVIYVFLPTMYTIKAVLSLHLGPTAFLFPSMPSGSECNRILTRTHQEMR